MKDLTRTNRELAEFESFALDWFWKLDRAELLEGHAELLRSSPPFTKLYTRSDDLDSLRR